MIPEHCELADPDGEAIEPPILSLFDQQWEAKKRGEPISPDLWQKLHPQGAGGMADLRLLDALYEAACAIKEDSHMRGESEPCQMDSPAKMGYQQKSTQQYISNDTGPLAKDQSGRVAELHEGDRIGKFEIKEILGRGGQAITYKAWDSDAERTVVVKAYHWAAMAVLQDAVIQEGQKLAKVHSPYVIQCYHVERLDGIPYLVLEYVPGQSLTKLHAATPLSVSESLRLIAKVAEGLAAVHGRGLLHRDVKPSNIVVGPNGIPKLVDFGLAKPLGDPDLGNMSGTFSYMAPEQARGDTDHVEPRTDVFGLGATLYFLLTGHAPYEGSPEDVLRAAREGVIVPPRQRNPKVPADVNRLCMRSLAKAPENRFESARSLAKHIERRWLRQFGKIALATAAIIASRFISRTSARPFTSTGATFAIFASREDSQFETLDSIVPLHSKDKVRISIRLAEPAYVRLLWIDADGEPAELYPNDPEAGYRGDQAVTEVESPLALDRGWPVEGAAGVETAVLMVSRERPRDLHLGAFRTGLPAGTLTQTVRRFAASRATVPSMGPSIKDTRSLGKNTQLVDDALLQLLERLRQDADMVEAVAIPHVKGEK